MTDRHTVDTITSDALDALYEQLEAAEESEAQRQLATARQAFASATSRAARAEHDLAALRQNSEAWASRANDTIQQLRQRAEQAEAAVAEQRRTTVDALDASQATLTRYRERAEQAEAERDRVRDYLTARLDQVAVDPADLVNLLDQPGPAGTEATDTQEQP
jgi:hypothetical protein